MKSVWVANKTIWVFSPNLITKDKFYTVQMVEETGLQKTGWRTGFSLLIYKSRQVNLYRFFFTRLGLKTGKIISGRFSHKTKCRGKNLFCWETCFTSCLLIPFYLPVWNTAMKKSLSRETCPDLELEGIRKLVRKPVFWRQVTETMLPGQILYNLPKLNFIGCQHNNIVVNW